MTDDDFDDEFDDEFDELDDDEDLEFLGDDDGPLDEHETALIEQDLVDLESFEATFRMEGYRGVSVFCQDCIEDHFYPWDMLRENLNVLLQTGDTPVHEPAFAPDPHEYVPWEYARGYVDAMRDVGVDARHEVGVCRCGFALPEGLTLANFCPRCGAPLIVSRLADVLAERGFDDEDVLAILRQIGLPGAPPSP